jgi:anti-sigma factor RsiW
MRHIPEDELHSYLDQALSRSQCVEIESHLAHCGACRGERDGIAALRDRTTALLSSLTPVRDRIPPSWGVLSRQAEERRSRRTARRQIGLWAASIVAALGLGWGAQALTHRPLPAESNLAQLRPAPVQTHRTSTGQQPAAFHAAAPVTRPESALVRSSVPGAQAERAERAIDASDRAIAAGDTLADPSPTEPVGTRLSTGRLPTSDFEFAGEGMWRTLSWDNAKRERGESVPRIRGLPVVEVQIGMSRGDSSGGPTMIVAQQLSSGQLIRTIEGPATDVTRLLASQHAESRSPWPTVQDSLAASDGTMSMLRGDRMLAIQASPSVPADSLRAMIRRLNAADR